MPGRADPPDHVQQLPPHPRGPQPPVGEDRGLQDAQLADRVRRPHPPRGVHQDALAGRRSRGPERFR